MDQGTQVILFTCPLPQCTEAPTYSARSHNSIRSYASTKQIFYWYFKSITQDVNCGCLNNSIIYSPIQPIEKFCFLNKFSDSMSLGKHYFSISKYYRTLRHMFLVVLSFSSFTLATFTHTCGRNDGIRASVFSNPWWNH